MHALANCHPTHATVGDENATFTFTFTFSCSCRDQEKNGDGNLK